MNKIYRFIFITIFAFLVLSGGCVKHTKKIQGYVETRFIFVSAHFSGILEKLFVRRGDKVAVNQKLFVLDQQPQSALVVKTKAEIKKAEAEAKHAAEQVEYKLIILKRRQYLVKTDNLSKEALDIAEIAYKEAQSNLKANRAKVKALQAELVKTSWEKQKKSIYAKRNAVVLDTYYLPTELIPAEQPVLSLYDPHETRVIFYVGEKLLAKIKIGQKIKFNCKGYSGFSSAKIDFISPQAEFTPPMLYSSESKTKFVYRVEGNPMAENTGCLHPGQPVNVILK